MKIDILSTFPHFFDNFLQTSILGRAVANGLIQVECTDIRLFSDSKHKNTDDYPYGGGAGMLMMAQPAADAIKKAAGPENSRAKVLYMSPKGTLFSQRLAEELSREEHLVLLCGHYEGIDQRVIDKYVDMEISIGDYILTGGELPAMVLTDCIARLIPGVLGSSESAEDESFSSEGLLEYPQYTRPREFEGMEVPEVLLNGDHAKIRAWRKEQSLLLTKEKRPDLYERYMRRLTQGEVNPGDHP